jgi:hypothetical protein
MQRGEKAAPGWNVKSLKTGQSFTTTEPEALDFKPLGKSIALCSIYDNTDDLLGASHAMQLTFSLFAHRCNHDGVARHKVYSVE